MPIYGIYALNWLCIPIYLAFGGSTQSHWRLHAESLATPCGVIGGSMRSHWRLHAESLAAPCGVNLRLHAGSFGGSMRGHSAAPCGVIRRLHAKSFGGSMRSHLTAPSGVICRLSCEPSSSSKQSHHTSCSNRHSQLNPKLGCSVVRWGDANLGMGLLPTLELVLFRRLDT